MDAAEFLAALPDLIPILGNDEDAKQDVAIRCWEHRERIYDLPRFARRAAANLRTDIAKRRSRRPAQISNGDPHTLADPRPTPLEQVARAEAVRGILGAMRESPRGQWEAAEARCLRGERLAEAARRLGRTVASVRSDWYRARQALGWRLTQGAER